MSNRYFQESYEVVPLETHLDTRGVLFEILRFKDQGVPGEGQLYCVTINPGERRGDHYHEKKREWFTCVSGQVVVLVEDKKGNKEKIVLTVDAPKVVYCGPYTVHALCNESEYPAVIISYGSKQHNPDDPDTFKKIIA